MLCFGFSDHALDVPGRGRKTLHSQSEWRCPDLCRFGGLPTRHFTKVRRKQLPSTNEHGIDLKDMAWLFPSECHIVFLLCTVPP